MNKMEMHAQAAEAAREAIRQSGITQTTGAVNRIPDLLEAVEFDSDYMRQRVEEILNRKTGNPVNALLRLMGLRIISTRKMAETLEPDEPMYTIGFARKDGRYESILKLNKQTLSDASKRMASELAKVETDFRAERKKSRDECNRVFGELDKKIQEQEQLEADFRGQTSMVLGYVQDILSFAGKDSDSQETHLLYDMLEEMGVSVFWTSEKAPFSDSAMFMELKSETPGQHRAKPCLANEDSVLLKGLRFVENTPE